MFFKDSFEPLGADGVMVVSLGFDVNFGDFFEKERLIFIISKILLFKVAAKAGRADEALNDCIHIACITNIIQP